MRPWSGVIFERMKTICIDFDGVIHSYTTPWEYAGLIPDPPVPGALEFITQCLDSGFRVVIQSTRATDPLGVQAISRWLLKYGFPRRHDLRITGEKPPASVYIDDRGYRFTGMFPDPKDLVAMEPWNRV